MRCLVRSALGGDGGGGRGDAGGTADVAAQCRHDAAGRAGGTAARIYKGRTGRRCGCGADGGGGGPLGLRLEARGGPGVCPGARSRLPRLSPLRTLALCHPSPSPSLVLVGHGVRCARQEEEESFLDSLPPAPPADHAGAMDLPLPPPLPLPNHDGLEPPAKRAAYGCGLQPPRHMVAAPSTETVGGHNNGILAPGAAMDASS